MSLMHSCDARCTKVKAIAPAHMERNSAPMGSCVAARRKRAPKHPNPHESIDHVLVDRLQAMQAWCDRRGREFVEEDFIIWWWPDSNWG